MAGQRVSEEPTDLEAPVEEILHLDETGRISRVRLPDGLMVIRKEALGTWAGERVRHEAAVLERLRGVPGVPQIVAGSVPGVLTFVDDGGEPLRNALREGPYDLAA